MLKPYDAVVNGVQTVLLLTDADAKARGLTLHNFLKTEPGPDLREVPPTTKAKKPANKTRTTRNKTA